MLPPSDDADRRDEDRGDRRLSQRRSAQGTPEVERRAGERRRIARRLIDVFRAFLHLPPER